MTTTTAVRERPILFSAPMVRAILAGTKTQTRRVIRDDWWRCLDPDDEDDLARAIPQCPYGKPGDRLWVRETHALASANHWPDLPHRCSPTGAHETAYYRASYDRATMLRWRPSIHMPRWASRITLEVTSVNVERLHEISEEDAKAEGVEPSFVMDGADFVAGRAIPPSTYRNGFARIWRDIHGEDSWDANPPVWVIEFRRVEDVGVAANQEVARHG